MNDIKELLRLKPHRQRKKTYCKPDSIKGLEDLYFEHERKKHPDFPYPVKTQFRDDSANSLTKTIKAWFTVNGGYVSRINTTGIYDIKLRRYRFGGATKGVADLVGTYKGRSVSVEIKFGKDKQSEQQVIYQKQTEHAGGIYIIARSFDDFLQQIRIFNIFNT